MGKLFIITLTLYFLRYDVLAIYFENHQQTDSLSSISFAAVGDLMCHGTQLKWANVDKDSFDFKPVFSEVKTLLTNPDFTIGNYETITRTDRKYKGYPVFNTPPEYLEALKYSGFDFLTTANNHSTDGRKTGIINTIKVMDSLDIHYVGTFKDRLDKDSTRVYSKNNITFSILSYTYGVNIDNLTNEDKYMVNSIDTTLMRDDIGKARAKGAEILIVYLHLGLENHKTPGYEQRRITSFLLNCGVDVILSASPHVLQPIDFVANKNSNVDSTLIVYSMGNFVSNQRWRYSDCGVIVNFSIKKNSDNQLRISDISYIPVWVYKGWISDKKHYVIHPSEQSIYDIYPNYFSESDRMKMKQSFEDSQAILSKLSDKAKLFSIYKPVVTKYDSLDAPIKPFDLGK